MRIHSDRAWEIASKYGFALSSETRDLAAWIDVAIAEERERCAKIAENFSRFNGVAVLETKLAIAKEIRKAI